MTKIDPVIRKDLFHLDFKRYVDGNYEYFCYAEPGTALNAKGWMIKRVENVGGEPDNSRFAEGKASFDFVAANHTTYNYNF